MDIRTGVDIGDDRLTASIEQPVLITRCVFHTLLQTRRYRRSDLADNLQGDIGDEITEIISGSSGEAPEARDATLGMQPRIGLAPSTEYVSQAKFSIHTIRCLFLPLSAADRLWGVRATSSRPLLRGWQHHCCAISHMRPSRSQT